MGRNGQVQKIGQCIQTLTIILSKHLFDVKNQLNMMTIYIYDIRRVCVTKAATPSPLHDHKGLGGVLRHLEKS